MRRAKWGIGAAVVVGVAWFLSNFFNMDIGGVGTDRGTDVSVTTPSSDSSIDVPEERTSAEPPVQSEPEMQPVAALGADDAVGTEGAVEVLIDGREFFLRRGDGEEGEWVKANGDSVVSYAKQATGDSTGVRVRIFRKPTARASAEETLVEALGLAGISSNEIDVPEKLVE